MSLPSRVLRHYGDGPAWRAWAIVFVATIVVYIPTAVTGPLQHIDTTASATQAWRLASEGTFDLRDRPDTEWLTEAEHRDQVVATRPGGPVLWGSAFYLLLDRTPRAASEPVPLWPSQVAAAVAAAAAMATLSLAFRRLLPAGGALVATGLAAFGTTTWAVSANALWPHSLAQLGLAIAIASDAAGRWWATGAGYAVGLSARLHLAAAAAVHGLYGAWRRQRWGVALRIGIVAAVGLVLTLGYNLWLFDSVVPPSHTDIADRTWSLGGILRGDVIGGLGFAAKNLVMTFVSPTRGLLPFSPFLLVLLPGIRTAWRAAPLWVRSAALAGTVTLLLQVVSNRYTGGDWYFGYRYPLEPLMLWAPLLVLAYREWVSPRRLMRLAFALTAVISVVFQALGATVLELGVRS